MSWFVKERKRSQTATRRYGKLLQENEKEAYGFFSRMQLVISAIYAAFGVLALTNVYSIERDFVLSMFIFAVISTVISFLMFKTSRGIPSRCLKYAASLMLLLSILVINIETGYKACLLYAVPIIISIRFYNHRFTIFTALLAMVMTVLSAYANAYHSAYTQLIDLNLVSFSEPVTLSCTSWLYSAVIEHGYDEWQVFINGLRLSAAHNCLILLFLAISADFIIANSGKMLTREGDEHEKEMQLMKKALTDGMTGLLNRRAYDENAAEIKKSDTLAFALFDLNSLKITNDTKGHSVGDELILGAAQCIREAFSPYGNVYRLGGDEFAAIIYASADQLKQIKSEFDKISARWSDGILSGLSISAGYASASELGDNFSMMNLKNLADQRMYESKRAYHRIKC